MNSESEQLRSAQWILERNLGWIAASDAKTGVVAAIDTAMLAGLAAAFSEAHHPVHNLWAMLYSCLAVAFLCIGMLWAARALFPRVSGPKKSHIYAGCIIEQSAADFADSFRRATVDQLLDDCLLQIHRNAEIASQKFRCVRAAMAWSLASVLPWICALAVLVGS